jgi:hypothetical protein
MFIHTTQPGVSGAGVLKLMRSRCEVRQEKGKDATVEGERAQKGAQGSEKGGVSRLAVAGKGKGGKEMGYGT